MGWLFGWGDRKSLVNHLLKDLDHDSEHSSLKCLAHTCVGNNLWAVCERTFKIADPKHPAGESYRFIMLFLMRKAGDGEWGYKDLDESCGPNEVSCPLAYLDMAGPEGPHLGEYSANWRKSVREYWARRHASQQFAKSLKPGFSFASGWGESPSIVVCRGFQGKNWIVGENSNGELFRYSRSRVGPVPTGTKLQPEPEWDQLARAERDAELSLTVGNGHA